MSLKNLIALQQQAKGKKNESPDHNKSDGAQAAESNETGSPAGGAEPATVSSAAAPASDSGVSEPAGAQTPGRKLGLGLNLVGAGRAVGKPAAVESRGGVGKGSGRVSGTADDDSSTIDSAEFSLEDLAGFEASDETAPSRPELGSGFDDEIEATAPDRILPPDLTQQQMNFVESLDGIYPVLHDPELFGQAVRIIMLEMQEHKEYKKLIADQDVHTMIRGMRNTMGLARIRKQEKSRKAGGGTKKAARGKSAVSDDDMALLESLLGGSLD